MMGKGTDDISLGRVEVVVREDVDAVGGMIRCLRSRDGVLEEREAYQYEKCFCSSILSANTVLGFPL